MTKRRFIAAAAQLTSRDDLEQNLDTCRRLAAQAAEQSAALLVLPECFAFLGPRERDKFAVAESLDADPAGPIMATLIEIAGEHSLYVMGGGMAERTEAEDGARELTTAYNTSVLIAPDGTLVGRYRKLHLFDVDIPGKATLKESAATAAGTELVAVDTEVGNIGLSICYDLRFPELYRDLAHRRGAQILTVPAAFTSHTGHYHWHALLRARAIENQCYVIAAAQTGRHNDKRNSFGHSAIYDPWGDLLAELPEGEGVITAEIDLDRVESVRRNMPCHDHAVLLK